MDCCCGRGRLLPGEVIELCRWVESLPVVCCCSAVPVFFAHPHRTNDRGERRRRRRQGGSCTCMVINGWRIIILRGWIVNRGSREGVDWWINYIKKPNEATSFWRLIASSVNYNRIFCWLWWGGDHVNRKWSADLCRRMAIGNKEHGCSTFLISLRLWKCCCNH